MVFIFLKRVIDVFSTTNIFSCCLCRKPYKDQEEKLYNDSICYSDISSTLSSDESMASKVLSYDDIKGLYVRDKLD